MKAGPLFYQSTAVVKAERSKQLLEIQFLQRMNPNDLSFPLVYVSSTW